MALKDIWKDIVDGVDEIKGEYTNQIAHSLIGVEDAFESHVKGEEYNHSAKDINYSGDYYNEEQNIEDAINYLGDEIDIHDGNISGNFKSIQKNTADITAIKKDIEASHNIFANALKGSATGEAIALKDTSPVEHIMDVKVRSKNLISYPFTSGSITINGISFTDNKDGSLTINGTLTQALEYTLVKSNTLSLKKGTYTFTIFNDDGSDLSGLQFYVRDVVKKQTISAVWPKTETALSKTFILTEDVEQVGVYFTINSGNIGTTYNGTIKPMLEISKIATAYAPYIEDISTVKLKALGKNPFNTQNLVTTNISSALNGSITEIGEDYFIITTKESETPIIGATTTTKTLSELCPNMIAGKTYTLSAETQSVEKHFRFAGIEKYWRFGETQTVTEDMLNAIVWCYGFATSKGQTTGSCKISNVMFELGDTATEYESYKEPVEYAVNPDGTVTDVRSIYPNMTLSTDTVGTVIDVEYNRDINKAFAELANAIVALGGTI